MNTKLNRWRTGLLTIGLFVCLTLGGLSAPAQSQSVPNDPPTNPPENVLPTQSDVQKYEIEMLSARLQLNQAKKKSAAVNASPRLTAELLNASLERAEKQARLAKTDSLLETIAPSRIAIAEFKSVDRKIEDLEQSVMVDRNSLFEAMAELEDLNAQLDDWRERDEYLP